MVVVRERRWLWWKEMKETVREEKRKKELIL